MFSALKHLSPQRTSFLRSFLPKTVSFPRFLTTPSQILSAARTERPRFRSGTPASSRPWSIVGLEGTRNQPPATPEEIWSSRTPHDVGPSADTYTGRRVFVTKGDLESALALLQRRLRHSRVFLEMKMTARHEKKGVKRRRLRSERWRKQFANEVRKKVKLVSTIRRRGA